MSKTISEQIAEKELRVNVKKYSPPPPSWAFKRCDFAGCRQLASVEMKCGDLIYHQCKRHAKEMSDQWTVASVARNAHGHYGGAS